MLSTGEKGRKVLEVAYCTVDSAGGDGPERLVEYVDRCSFVFSSRRRHTRLRGDWSSDVCSSDLFYFVVNLWKRIRSG